MGGWKETIARSRRAIGMALPPGGRAGPVRIAEGTWRIVKGTMYAITGRPVYLLRGSLRRSW